MIGLTVAGVAVNAGLISTNVLAESKSTYRVIPKRYTDGQPYMVYDKYNNSFPEEDGKHYEELSVKELKERIKSCVDSFGFDVHVYDGKNSLIAFSQGYEEEMFDLL